MGLFDEQWREAMRYVAEQRGAGALRQLAVPSGAPWPEERSLVLADEAGRELGHPGEGSAGALLWCDAALSDADELAGVLLVGPDLAELPYGSCVSLAQLALLAGRFDDPYPQHRAAADALAEVQLRGVMARTRPSQQSIWYRVSRDALAAGLSLAHLGAALVARLEELPFIARAVLLFVVDRVEGLQRLRPLAREASRIGLALAKRSEEPVPECDSCEYADICGEGRAEDTHERG